MLGTLAVGCGDKSSSPDAVTVDELKYPGNLVIWDKGDGSVTLSWAGANNEDDFDGYNVYGVKGKPADLGVTEHAAIELLDDKGEQNANAVTILNKFNYDPAKKLGLAASLADSTATADKDKPEFSSLPIHTVSGEDKLLPTCKAKGGSCTMTTAANKDTTASSDPSYAVNGRVSFDVPDTLTVGEEYCFFVMASEDNGKKVSQTSSNVECVIPKYKLEMSLPLPATNDDNEVFDLRAILTACGTAGKCDATAAAANVKKADDSTGGQTNKRDHVAKDPGPVYIEKSSTTGALGFVAGNAAAVNDIGYYKNGLDDTSLPRTAPVLVADDTPIGTGNNSEAPIFNAGGYSVPGQTVPLVANHVYVIAVGATGATGAGPYNYHWLYVGADPTGSTVAVKMRLTKGAL
jgi:hypothetical protein